MVLQTDLELGTVWRIGTTHLEESDTWRLSETPLLDVQEDLDGFWIAVPKDAATRLWRAIPDTGEQVDLLHQAGFSLALGRIIAIALSHNVDYLRITADGPEYSFLPQFHW